MRFQAFFFETSDADCVLSRLTRRGDNNLKYIILPDRPHDIGVDYEIRKFNLNPNGDSWV